MPMFAHSNTYTLHAKSRIEEYVKNGIFQLQAACCTDYSQDAGLLQGNWTNPVRFSAHLLPFSIYIYIYTSFRVTLTTTCLCVQLPVY